MGTLAVLGGLFIKCNTKWPCFNNRLFVCQNKNENEPENETFRSFWIKPVTNKPGPQYYDTLKHRFVRWPERTKDLVFVSLLNEEANSIYNVDYVGVSVHCARVVP